MTKTFNHQHGRNKNRRKLLWEKELNYAVKNSWRNHSPTAGDRVRMDKYFISDLSLGQCCFTGRCEVQICIGACSLDYGGFHKNK